VVTCAPTTRNQRFFELVLRFGDNRPLENRPHLLTPVYMKTLIFSSLAIAILALFLFIQLQADPVESGVVQISPPDRDWVQNFVTGDLDALIENLIPIPPAGETPRNISRNTARYLLLGKVLTSSGKLNLAENHYRQVLNPNFDRATNPDLFYQAQCGAARIAIRQSDFASALSLLESCHDYFLLSKSANPSAFADALHLKGLYSHERGNLDSALEYYTSSLSYRTEHDLLSSISRAATINNIANVYWKRGLYQAALSFHQRSLALKLKFLSADHPDVASSYNNIGALLEDLGDYNRAESYHAQALRIRSTRLNEHPFTAHSYHNLAESINAQGRHSEALVYVNTALKMKTKLLDADHFDRINSVSLLGQIQFDLQNLQSADSLFTQTFLYCKTFAHYSCAYIYHNMMGFFESYSQSSTIPDDQQLISKIISITGRKHPLVMQAYNELAESQMSKGRFDKALEYLNTSFQINASSDLSSLIQDRHEKFLHVDFDLLIQSLEIAVEALSLKAEAESIIEQQQTLTRLLKVTSYAISAIENSLATIRVEVPLLKTSERVELLVRSGAQAAIQLHRIFNDESFIRHAFSFIDYANNWILQSQLAEIRAFELAGASESEITEMKALLNSSLEQNRIAESSDVRAFPEMINPARDSLFQITENLTKHKLLLAHQYPLYVDYRPRYNVNNTSYLDRFLHSNDSNIIQYVTLNDSLYAFVITEDSFNYLPLASQEEVTQLADSLEHSISSHRIALYLESSFGLYSSVFESLESLLTSERIFLITNATVSGFSFESLVTSDSITFNQSLSYSDLDYLIKDFQFSYGYAASMISNDANLGKTEFSKDILAFAPVFDKSTSYSSDVAGFLRKHMDVDESTTPKLAELPGSAKEVSGIAQIMKHKEGWWKSWSAKESDVLLRRKSAEHVLKSTDLNSYRYIHFATHGFADQDDPGSSGIILQTEGSDGEDGILYASEIFGLSLNAELVVLSSCDTAKGSKTDTSGLAGFSRGFIYAGAQNLVASLWPSDDVGTQVLMEHFYYEMSLGNPSDTALRNAKLKLINSRSPIAKPYYWSGFIHIGVPSVNDFRKPSEPTPGDV